MKKIPSIFVRDWNGDRSRVTREQNPECGWVFAGEGFATRKHDGSAVLVRGDELLCRYDAKKGKTPPMNFEPAQESPDPETGHWPGWVPAGIAPVYRWHVTAFENSKSAAILDGDGTYEACGPHFQGNPEKYEKDVLVKHGSERLEAPREYDDLSAWLADKEIEGIVWHHPDGRMAKIKLSDFGIKRPVRP